MEKHLGPMENINCWAFRKLITGATDTYTGMLSVSNLIKRENTWKEVDTFPIVGQRQWLQIASSKESDIAILIPKLLQKLKEDPTKDNIYGIELNASCPSPEIIGVGQGAALIKRATKLSNLIKELLKQDKFKVGIKLRLGLNGEELKQGKIFSLLSELEKINNPNLTHVAIHFKHAKDRSSTPYNYSLLDEISKFNLPLIINGGIKSEKDYLALIDPILDKSNIRGYMVARAALFNPNFFLPTDAHQRTPVEIKEEFIENCKIHSPNPLYIETISKACPWMK